MCYLTRCILGVHVGGRSADDLKSFLKSFPQAQGRITFTDDLAAYAAVLPKGAHFTGKMHTQRLESLNANVRHHLARFRRKTRCTTKCPRMAYLSALLFMQAHNKKLCKYPPAEPGALVESRSKRRFAALRGRNLFAA